MPKLHTDESVTYEFLIPGDSRTWPSRLEAACQLLESHPALPRAPMTTSSRSKDNSRYQLDNRREYLEKSSRGQRRVIVSNGRRQDFAHEEIEDSGLVLLRSGDSQPAESWGIHIRVPTIAPASRVGLLASLGDTLEAYSGYHLSEAAFWLLHVRADERTRQELGAATPQLMRDLQTTLDAAKITLPTLETNHGRHSSEHQPGLLGWINYWSAETARHIGFDGDHLASGASVSRSPNGAWIVQITPAMLDLTRTEDLRLYSQWLQRYPGIGIRHS